MASSGLAVRVGPRNEARRGHRLAARGPAERASNAYKKKGGTRCPLDLAVAEATYRFLAVFLAAFFAFLAFFAM